MAVNTTKKTNTKATAAKVNTKVENIVEEAKIEAAPTVDKTESVVEEKEIIKEPKKYEPSEGIMCRSITPGGLYMEGIKTHIPYEWSDNGLETEVEYQDLVAAIRANSDYVMKPYFIIQDDEFIQQYPQLSKVYDSMYSVKDMRDVLTLPASTMKQVITNMPDGAKESIKHIASSMISNGSLDSVQKIKILDQIFGTELMLMTGLFNE